MKKYTSLFIISSLVFSSFGLFGIARKATANISAPLQNLRQEVKEMRDDFKEKRDETRKEMQEKKEMMGTERKDQVEKMREEREALREGAKAKFQTLKEGIKNEKDQVRAKIKEARIIGREKVLAVFDKMTEKITNLKDRIVFQITKLEAKGVDTAKAEEFITVAEGKLGEAETKVAEINALLAISADQLSAENKASLRTLKEEVQNLIKETRQAFGNAVKSLKDSIQAKREATANTVSSEIEND